MITRRELERTSAAKALFGEPGVDNMLPFQDLNLKLRPSDVETGSTEQQHYFTVMKANRQTLESACE